VRRLFPWSAAILVALVVLIVADRFLRRATQLDQLILQGQTGFDWLDEYLNRRAAERAALKERRAAIAGATNLVGRLEAWYALHDFEVRRGRGDGRRARTTLRAIVTEGESHPLTIPAWRLLLQAAVAAREHKDFLRSLAESYLAALENLPPSQEHWTGLLEVWRLADQHRFADLELTVLEQIHRDYPREITAEPAYQALAARYRRANQTDRLPALEESIREVRRLALAETDERALGKELQQQLTEKNLPVAETTFFRLTPSLTPAADYRALLRKLLGFYTAPDQLPAALRVVAFAADRSSPAQVSLEELAVLRLTQAVWQFESGQDEPGRATLGKVPPFTALDDWRAHVQARTELMAGRRPQSVPTVDVARGQSERAWVQLPGPPPWRWRAWSDDRQLTIEIQADEPNRAGIVAARTSHDSDVWLDDGVELFLASQRSDAAYYQLAVNTRGVLTDVRHVRQMDLIPFTYAADRGWTSNAVIEPAWLTYGWRLIVRLPWQDGILSPSDRACFFNVRRLRYVTGKQQVFDWSPRNNLPHRPAAFGILLLQP